MIDVVLSHFQTLDLRYLEASLYSICHQRDLSRVERILVYDNDSSDRESDIRRLVADHTKVLPPHVSVEVVIDKHGVEAQRSHPYAVNRGMERPGNDWVFYTRSDYILHRHAFDLFLGAIPPDEPRMLDTPIFWRGFVTSYVYHQALDARMDQRVAGFRDIERYDWRTHPESTDVLLREVEGWRVETSHRDAGIWMTRRSLWREVGGFDERLVIWGFPQTLFQKALRDVNVAIVQVPRFLGHHMHHGGFLRNYDLGKAEMVAAGIPVETLNDFRDIRHLHGNVCDELGPIKPLP